MPPAIRVHSLCKDYKLRSPAAQNHDTLRDRFSGLFTRDTLAGSLSSPRQPLLFSALKDICCEIQPGDVLGIIGRNGAGKSTLLKIISRITAPTRGEVTIRGRVGSLLEVGTGFHSELSGRENIYLNGSILGLNKYEIDRRFDEIVAFSEVEPFLDTPIKRYSSGMQMRLAFSVAAHLEPEILIIDEVLAVGDFSFQQKCLGKMQHVATSGRTVLFVSHNTNAIMKLCNSVLWLENGRINSFGYDVRNQCFNYLGLSRGSTLRSMYIAHLDGRLDTEYFSLVQMQIIDHSGNSTQDPIAADQSFKIRIELDIHKTHPALNFGIAVFAGDGEPLFWSLTTDTDPSVWPKLHTGRCEISTAIPAHFLNEGVYRIDFFASLHAQGYFSEPGRTTAHVMIRITGGLSTSPYWHSRRPGHFAPILQWRLT